jgi:hypothetical protein
MPTFRRTVTLLTAGLLVAAGCGGGDDGGGTAGGSTDGGGGDGEVEAGACPVVALVTAVGPVEV